VNEVSIKINIEKMALGVLNYKTLPDVHEKSKFSTTINMNRPHVLYN